MAKRQKSATTENKRQDGLIGSIRLPENEDREETAAPISSAVVRPAKQREQAKALAPVVSLAGVRRRTIRYILFRIKRGTSETMDSDLRALVPTIEEYFRPLLAADGLNWDGFTFDWDLSPNEPFDVIGPSMRQWVQSGGWFEGRPGEMTEAEWAQSVLHNGTAARRKPTAFTHQA